MANTYVNKVVQSDGTVLIDISDTTATADKILQGYTAYGANGEKITGTASSGGGAGGVAMIVDTLDAAGGTIREITATELTQAQEGKVVHNGALVSQSSATYTENNTYDTTLVNSVTVNVGRVSNEKTVKFIDYDGTEIASYTPIEFAALSALPANPTHTGLTSQGWNWTLADAKSYVADNTYLTIGQMYITSDGKTRFYITIDDIEQRTITLTITHDTDGVSIDWGDGSEVENTGSYSNYSYLHEYPNIGNYVITLTVLSGTLTLGTTSTSQDNTRAKVFTRRDGTGNFLRKAEIGESVDFYGRLFEGCYSLETVTIPNYVTGIYYQTFYYCFSLKNIIIPSSVTTASGGSYFYNCYSLQNVSIPKTAPIISGFNNCYLIDRAMFTINGTSTSIANLTDCKSLKTAVIPEGVLTISSDAFNGCNSLKSIVLPDTLTTISANAFDGCCELEDITIPDSVTSIGNYAFRNCNSLKSINIPDGVTSIGNYAFAGCNSLENIVIPDSVETLGTYVFQNCHSLKSVILSSELTTINTYTFSGCRSLKSINIPQSVTSIGTYAFNECYALESVVLPEALKTLSANLFYNCYSLENINIPDGLTSIGTYTFYGCRNLKSITLPELITSIPSNCFSSCASLKEIVISGTLTTISSSAFSACYSLKKMEYPSTATSIAATVFQYCYSLTSFTIPKTVTSIAANAFNNCTGLMALYALPTSPPTVSSSNILYGFSSNLKIYVPYSEDHSILNAYKTAKNWSTHASKMVEMPAPVV